jgi:murein DD-endopeptidase MepM/ murein hydrolase activator NlpD
MSRKEIDLGMTFCKPFAGNYPVICYYGQHRSFMLDGKPYSDIHTGIDYGMPIGTPLYAISDGVVTYSGQDQYEANYIDIFLDVNGQTIRYLHLNSRLVEEGKAVKMGELIGYSGNTGLVTGPHLHFENANNHNPNVLYIDPLTGEFDKSVYVEPNFIEPPMTDELKTCMVNTLRSYPDLSSATIPDFGMNFTDIETKIANLHPDQALAVVLDFARGLQKDKTELLQTRQELWAEIEALKTPTK